MAVGPGQEHVEDDDVVVARGRLRERLVAIAGEIDRVSLAPQAALERPRQLQVVLDQQQTNARRGAPRRLGG
jgi:hypothetical protein